MGRCTRRMRMKYSRFIWAAFVCLGITLYFMNTTKSLDNDTSKNTDAKLRSTIKTSTTTTTERPFAQIIHQYWDTPDIPDQFLLWIRSWIKTNPNWEYWFWTKEDALKLFASYPEVGAMYFNKTDYEALAILKYLVIYHFGGVFVDIDFKAVNPLGLRNITSEYPCFGLEENHVEAFLRHSRKNPLTISDIIGCRPGHPLFKKIFQILSIYARTRKTDAKKNSHNIDSAFFDKMVRDYNEPKSKWLTKGEMFYRLPTDSFMGTWNPSIPVQEWCSETSFTKAITLCEELSEQQWDNTPVLGAYGEHMWIYPENWNPPYTGIKLNVYTFVQIARKPRYEM